MLSKWIGKIFAYLHDPPHKPVVLGKGHAAIGERLAEAIAGVPASRELLSVIEQADHWAAGADRSHFLRDVGTDPRKDLTLIHPLDATSLADRRDKELVFAEVLIGPEDADHARDLVEGPARADGSRDLAQSALVQAFRSIADERIRYPALWRFLPEVLRASEASDPHRFGALWDVLPADTRMPNHPVLVHNSLVAALATVLLEGKRPWLLRFQIGPVQPFIEAARSLADLWAGSYWLSELVYCALKPIADEFGPDSILFPSLRGQPLYDRDLCSKIRQSVPKLDGPLAGVVQACEDRIKHSMRIPSLPNVFVAIVPEDQAEQFAQCAEQAVRDAFRKRVIEMCRELTEEIEKARSQADDFLEVFWAVTAWPHAPAGPGAFLADPRLAWPSEVVQNLQAVLNAAQSLPGYQPNDGFLYPIAVQQASLALDAVKRDRLQGQDGREELGLKCTMCGEREVLGGSDYFAQKQFWEAAKRDAIVKPGESLCAICYAKRRVGREECREAFGRGRPSTTEVATARFKLEVIQGAADKDSLRKAVDDYMRACQGLSDAAHVFTPPAVWEATRDDDYLNEFARLDGEWLLPIAREEVGEKVEQGIRGAAGGLVKAAVQLGIPLPSPYLAVVVCDGDEMGKWLSGLNAPRLWEMLHLVAQEQLKSAQSALEGVSRPITPAIQAAISEACCAFAQEAVPWTVEREGWPGYLVYAGGDDALFLAPPADALRLAMHLRLRFSGHPASLRGVSIESVLQDGPKNRVEEQQPTRPELPPTRPWFRSKDGRIRLAFGKAATMSAGMCVFHAKHPLADALEQAREAERAAKGRGRNRLGVTVLRRSGQVSQIVVPFEWRSAGPEPVAYPVARLCELTEFFANHEVTRSLGTLLRQEVAALRPEAGLAPGMTSDRLRAMAENLVRRVIDRRLLQSDDDVKRLRGLVLALGEFLVRPNDATWLLEWAEWVSVAEFLARPYDRRGEEGR